MTQLSKEAVEFLEDRGIDLEIAVQENVFSATPRAGKLISDAQGRWIGFPYMRGENRVGCKYRYTQDKRFQQDKGSEQILWRRDVLKGASKVIITEGEMDALSALTAGYSCVVSVPGGAPAEVGSKVHPYLHDAMPDLKSASQIILAFDNDGPGANLFEDVVATLGPAVCRFVEYPEGCKDLNDVLLKHGEEGVNVVIEAAKLVPVDGIFKPEDMPMLPPLEVFRTGLSEDADSRIGICKQMTSFWTGYAGHGKSTLLRQAAVALAKHHGWKIAVAAPEDDFQRNYPGDVAAAYWQRGVDEMSKAQKREAYDFYKDHFLLIQEPEDATIRLSWLFERMEVAVKRYGADFIIVDPFTELDLEMSRGENEVRVIGEALDLFNRFARKMNVHVAIVAHPRKPESGNEKYPPGGYSIAGSAHWKNKCYLGITVHRDPDIAFATQVKVWKVKRRDPMGEPGTFYMEYDDRASILLPMTESKYRNCVEIVDNEKIEAAAKKSKKSKAA